MAYIKNHCEEYRKWFVYTVIMGVIPSIIKALILLLVGKSIIFESFRVELFFLTILFFVDAFKTEMPQNKKDFAVIAIIICSVIYTMVLAGDLGLLKDQYQLSSVAVFWSFGAFLLVSLLIDFTCVGSQNLASVNQETVDEQPQNVATS